MTQAMLKGSNIQLAVTAVRAVLRWTPGAEVPDIDASALLLGADGRVRADADFVFYNQPRHPSGLVRRLPKKRVADALTDTVEAELSGLGEDVNRVLIAASADGGTFGAVPDLELTLYAAASGEGLATFAVTPDTGEETALICGELYRRDGGWKFRALGQGYTTGLIGLATECGVSVDDADDTDDAALGEDADAGEGQPTDDTVPQPPDPEPVPIPDPVPEPEPAPRPEPEPSPVPEPQPEPHPEPRPAPDPEPQPRPEPAAAVPGYGYPPAAPAQPAQPAPPGHGYGYPPPPAAPPGAPAAPPPPPRMPAPGAPPPIPDPAFTLPPQGPQFLTR